MIKIIKVVLLFVMAFVLNACITAKPNMEYSIPSKAMSPSSDKALLVFVRPQQLGFSANASIYDGDKFVGIIPFDHKLGYLAEPGEHLFMVVSEAADFMKANLEAGKTYYVEVTPRMGVWGARFSLRPILPVTISTAEQKEWLGKGPFVQNTLEAYAYAKENKTSDMEKKQAYLVKWQSKSEFNKPSLGEKHAIR